jgi:NADPH2:quinone reductase
VRAAVLHSFGETPVVGDFPDPSGDAVVEVSAAALNPIDLRIASGTLAAVRPPLPYVVGSEGIGTFEGRRVYFDVRGAAAERVAVDPGDVVEVPDGLEDGHALCYGIAGLAAWLALEKGPVRPGSRVLVLGATGIVGLIGVQAAKLMGAGVVVAAGRSPEGLERARELGADATVSLTGDDLPERMREAAGGDLDLVLDPVWGAPAAAAVEALAFGGALVNLGQSAGAEASLASVAVRFKELRILGHTNFAASREARHAALARMWEHAAAGELQAAYEVLPLAAIGDAWERQASSPGVKLVVSPR